MNMYETAQDAPMGSAHGRRERRQRTENADVLDKLNTHDLKTLTQDLGVVNPYMDFA